MWRIIALYLPSRPARLTYRLRSSFPAQRTVERNMTYCASMLSLLLLCAVLVAAPAPHSRPRKHNRPKQRAQNLVDLPSIRAFVGQPSLQSVSKNITLVPEVQSVARPPCTNSYCPGPKLTRRWLDSDGVIRPWSKEASDFEQIAKQRLERTADTARQESRCGSGTDTTKRQKVSGPPTNPRVVHRRVDGRWRRQKVVETGLLGDWDDGDNNQGSSRALVFEF